MAEQIISKKCCICKRIKPLSEFYKARREKDGHQAQCKICSSDYGKEYNQTIQGKAAQKRYRQTENRKITQKRYRQTEKYKTTRKCYSKSAKGKTKHKIYQIRYSLRHPERVNAHKAMKYAIRDGKLPRPDTLKCHYCPAQAKHYHHHKGYAPEHWLDVVPVCVKCHSKIPV